VFGISAKDEELEWINFNTRKSLSKYSLNTIHFNIFINDTWQKYSGDFKITRGLERRF
jgi:hypothetical protein